MTVDKLLALILEGKASGKLKGYDEIYFDDDEYLHVVESGSVQEERGGTSYLQLSYETG